METREIECLLTGPGVLKDVLADHADEHQQRADKREQDELERCAPRPLSLAEKPEQEVGRDEHGLPEHIEKDEVGGHQHPGHAGRHREHQGQEPADVAHCDRCGQHRNHRQQGVQNQEPDADSVHTQLVEDVQLGDPGHMLGELEAVVVRGEQDGHDAGDEKRS